MKSVELVRLHDFQDMIAQPETTIQDRMKLVSEEIREYQEATTFSNLVKEMVDVMVVSYAVYMFHPIKIVSQAHLNQVYAMADALKYGGIDPWKALKVVNDSNFSKFVLPHEIDAAAKHFEAQGIISRIQPLDDACNYYGVYSAKDQTVNGKDYPENKLLKGHNYHAVDESIEWWK